MNRFVACFLLIFPILSSYTDDGSWNANYSLSGGALYSETEHQDVALVDEILVFDGFEEGTTRAVFFFSNTSAKDLEVQAGFPVQVCLFLEEDVIPGTKDQKGFFFKEQQYGPPSNAIEYSRVALGKALKTGEFPVDEYIGHSTEYFLSKDVPVRNEISASDISDWFELSIMQDGKPVPLTTVVTEAKLVKGKERDSQVMLEITFHYRHVLRFKAGMTSRVEVRYTSECASGSDRGGSKETTSYSYTYILGTGRTWKGSIHRLYLITPGGANPTLPQAFQRLGRMGGKEVYLAERYEPSPEDTIVMRAVQIEQVYEAYLNSIWFGNRQVLEPPKKPAQDFVVVKGASSFLRETADSYTLEGVIPNVGFRPLSLFDGFPETAWCEGVPGDGIGEWVEFELKQDTEAIDVWNGYQRASHRIEGKNLHQYFGWNNRVKTLEIVSSDGKIRKTLNLKDSQEKQTFEDLYLPKGTYRAYVREIYKGTRWQDTCLGELVFHPASSLYPRLKSDPFLKEQVAPLLNQPAIPTAKSMEKALIGNWEAIRGEYEEISFSKEGRKRTFSSYLHGRLFEDGNWILERNNLKIELGTGETLLFKEVTVIDNVLSLDNGKQQYRRMK
ncbi:MAG: hypothetical protein N2442_05845 [Spirochaetes bacterium]|nr:hypothetical protein [Spirochaetota bacterium]